MRPECIRHWFAVSAVAEITAEYCRPRLIRLLCVVYLAVLFLLNTGRCFWLWRPHHLVDLFNERTWFGQGVVKLMFQCLLVCKMLFLTVHERVSPR